MSKPKLDVSPIRPAKGLRFARPNRERSMYADLLDRIAKLRPNESVVVAVPAGVPLRTMHNRLNAALRRRRMAPPPGCRIEKRTTADKRIAVLCVPRDRKAS